MMPTEYYSMRIQYLILTGWLKGLGSEGLMCRWAIMACSRSLSLANCGRQMSTLNTTEITLLDLYYTYAFIALHNFYLQEEVNYRIYCKVVHLRVMLWYSNFISMLSMVSPNKGALNLYNKHFTITEKEKIILWFKAFTKLKVN